MKILYYSKPYFGDCDLPLIKALRAKGHEVIVLFSMSPHSMKTNVFNIEKIYPDDGIFPIDIYPELSSFANYLSLDNIYVVNETTGRLGWSSFKLALKTIKFFRQTKCDVINYVETPSLFHAFFLFLFRKKLILTIHDGKPHSGSYNLKGKLIRLLSKLYIKKYIVLNKAEVDVFSHEYSISKDKIYTSHLGYYDMLHMYGNTQHPRGDYILFFGRISKYKGIEFLLQAMEEVHKVKPKLRVIIAGGGKYYFDTSKYLTKDYIEFRNYFIGLDELSNLIRGALFTVCPYTDATQSGVVYSSFALGTPVIGTNVGGLPEMIDDGYTGVIVPPCSSTALKNAILDLLDNPTKLDSFKENIKISSSLGKGSWDLIAEEYIEIYKQ